MLFRSVGLVCESVDKADLLSDHFDSKPPREAVDLLLTCHLSPSLTTFAFRSGEVNRPLLDLDPCGGTDPLGMFPLFLQRTADVLATHLSVVFRRLVRQGSFPVGWRQANVTPIPKGPQSSSVANYRQITSVFAPGVCSSYTMYGTQWGASNHLVCLLERYGYL